MTIPTITTIIDPPLPTDAPAIFDQKAFAAWASLNTWAGEVNDVATQVNIDADRVNDPAVQTVAANITSIVAVANNKTNIDRVSSNQTNINTASANDTNIRTVAGISSQVTTVAGMKTTVEAVNNNKTNINNVAGNKANIDNVAGNRTNINTVAGNSANVTTVATNISSVNITAGNISAIIDAPTQATKAQTQATLADGYRQQAAASSTTATAAATAASSSASLAQTAAATAQAIVWQGTTGYPKIRPSLLLDFANSKTVDPRITFTRSSTASYWDDKGILRQALAGQPRIDHDPVTGECKGLLIEESRTNAFLHSEDFLTFRSLDNAVLLRHATVSPDGKLRAVKLIEDNALGVHQIEVIQATNINTTNVFSVYAKAGERKELLLEMGRSFLYYDMGTALFDLQTGQIISNANGKAKITHIGNGWYRCSIVATRNDVPTGGALVVSIKLYNSTSTYQGDGTSGLFLWGAQTEFESSFPTSYIPTPATFTSRASEGTYFDSTGLLKTAAIDEPRYDHGLVDGVWVPKGLLLEPQRTNLLTYSEQFGNADWTKNGATISANATVAPDGTLTAGKLVEDSSMNQHRAYKIQPGITQGIYYCVSVYIKSAERRYFRMLSYSGPGDAQSVTVDTINGSIVGSVSSFNPKITNVGNGWFRLEYAFSNNSDTDTSIDFNILDDSRSASYQGNGTSGIYIWGAQLEEIPAGQSPEPSSYIKTEATAVTRSADVSTSSAVTRAADDITGGHAFVKDWFNKDEGTFFVSFEDGGNKNHTGSFRHALSMKRSTPANPSNYIGILTLNDGRREGAVTVESSYSAKIGQTQSKGSLEQIAMAYKLDSFAYSSSGSLTVDPSGPVPYGIDSINIGSVFDRNRLGYLNGHIAKLSYYPKRLANNELQALTAE